MSASTQPSHLAIGEVLSLIQQEFPDVTISKIRFLESQGLIAPERTSSGFRKFYNDDIQRLRWILRQQSDHFLPLKVIKKMLDDGLDPMSNGGPMGTQPTLWSDPQTQVSAASADNESTKAGVADSASSGKGESASGGVDSGGSDTGARDDPAVDLRGDTTGVDGPDQNERRASTAPPRSPAHPSVVAAAMVRAANAAHSTPPESQGGKAMADSGDRDSAPLGESPAQSAPDAGGTPPSSEQRGSRSADDTPSTPSRTINTPADIVAALQEDPRRPGTRRSRSERSNVGSRDNDATASATRRFTVEEIASSGDSEFLSAEEVCDMFDADESLLGDLERFGLIEPRRFGGAISYAESDLEVIGMAVRYASMGIEARHLRMYKIAAEREAGFVEQLVVPLLKQRNPTARENAAERASELASMGDELHKLILRRHLRNLLSRR